MIRLATIVLASLAIAGSASALVRNNNSPVNPDACMNVERTKCQQQHCDNISCRPQYEQCIRDAMTRCGVNGGSVGPSVMLFKLTVKPVTPFISKAPITNLLTGKAGR